MINVAIIGAGRIGQIHAANVYRNNRASLRVVSDVSRDAATALADRYAAAIGSVDDVLGNADIDAVIIASPTDTHADLVEQSAQAGKAIFCEKPLDLSAARAAQCVERVGRTDSLLAIGFNRRHDPSFSRLHDEISDGRIGRVEVVSITSRDPAPPPVDYIARSGGLFRDMMIHDFDIGRWLLGEEPVEVFATGTAIVDPEIGKAGDIDTAAVVMRTASGKLCQITNSRRCSYGYDQRIEVFGSDGMVRAANQTDTRVEVATATGFTTEPAQAFFLERYADAYRIQMDRFVEAAHGGADRLPGGDDGVRALVLADAAQESLATRGPIRISA